MTHELFAEAKSETPLFRRRSQSSHLGRKTRYNNVIKEMEDKSQKRQQLGFGQNSRLRAKSTPTEDEPE